MLGNLFLSIPIIGTVLSFGIAVVAGLLDKSENPTIAMLLFLVVAGLLSIAMWVTSGVTWGMMHLLGV